MTSESTYGEAMPSLEGWWAELNPPGQDPQTYAMSAGLIVLEGMRQSFPLTRDHYVTGGNRLRSSGSRIQNILAKHGEERSFTREGGRTTSGAVPAAESLAERLNAVEAIGDLTEEQREELAHRMQAWLVAHVRDYFERQQIAVEIDLVKPGPHIVADIIRAAGAKAGAVAQHLVGAKLSLRYPKCEIANFSYTTADRQLGRAGDFFVGNTTFHVTVAPMPQVIEKCAENLRGGHRVVLLVPGSRVQAASQMAEADDLDARVWVAAIESFVGQNIEEIGGFGRDGLARGFRALLETYNGRVAEVESDRSLMIDIPANL